MLFCDSGINDYFHGGVATTQSVSLNFYVVYCGLGWSNMNSAAIAAIGPAVVCSTGSGESDLSGR